MKPFNIKNQNFSRAAPGARDAGGAGSERQRGGRSSRGRAAPSPRCPPGPALPARGGALQGRAGRYQVSGAAGAAAAGGPSAGPGAAHAAGRPRSGGAVRSAPRRARCPAGEVALRPSLSLVPRRRLLPPPPSLQCASRSFPLFLPARRRSAGARLARAPPRSCSSQEAAAPPRSRRRRFQAAPGPRSASRVRSRGCSAAARGAARKLRRGCGRSARSLLPRGLSESEAGGKGEIPGFWRGYFRGERAQNVLSGLWARGAPRISHIPAGRGAGRLLPSPPGDAERIHAPSSRPGNASGSPLCRRGAAVSALASPRAEGIASASPALKKPQDVCMCVLACLWVHGYLYICVCISPCSPRVCSAV